MAAMLLIVARCRPPGGRFRPACTRDRAPPRVWPGRGSPCPRHHLAAAGGSAARDARPSAVASEPPQPPTCRAAQAPAVPRIRLTQAALAHAGRPRVRPSPPLRSRRPDSAPGRQPVATRTPAGSRPRSASPALPPAPRSPDSLTTGSCPGAEPSSPAPGSAPRTEPAPADSSRARPRWRRNDPGRRGPPARGAC